METTHLEKNKESFIEKSID